MRVCRHGLDVKMFCFAHANHSKHEFKKCFEDENLISLPYSPIPLLAETWKSFRNMLCQFFFFAFKADILIKLFSSCFCEIPLYLRCLLEKWSGRVQL